MNAQAFLNDAIKAPLPLSPPEGSKIDVVNHPPHYTSHPSGVECIDIVEQMSFNAGSAIKYLWRAGLKIGAPAIVDVEKAAWYAAREVQRLRKAVQGKA